jgi:hypothetical protein
MPPETKTHFRLKRAQLKAGTISVQANGLREADRQPIENPYTPANFMDS